MQSRSRTLLTFALCCVLPLLLISGANFFVNLGSSKAHLRDELTHELSATSRSFETLLQQRKQEIASLAESTALRSYVRTASDRTPASPQGQPEANANGTAQPADNDLNQTKNLIASLLQAPHGYALFATFSPSHEPTFVAEAPPAKGGDIVFRTRDLRANQIQLGEAAWTTQKDQINCSIVSVAAAGKILRCTSPVIFSEIENAHGVLVADLRLDSVIAAAAGPLESALVENQNSSHRSTMVVVIDVQGDIVYHTNAALKHQPARPSMPYFAPIEAEMTAGHSGTNSFTSAEGDQWLAVYAPLLENKLSLAVARDYSLASHDARRYGWLGIALAVLLGFAAALFLTNYYQRRTESIDRVAAGVDEIAKGKLDHRIELLSSDDLRPLADNVGLMTQQLRDQLAREAESRQFESFVRLSAVLTHDLKNAIEALSLIVNNMEQHFEKEEFRVDAMRSLTTATDKLRALVARLSGPVNTLSGEHKRPRPVDLIPILKRVITMNAEPARAQHEIKIDLPDSLMALVDADRMDKVMENLIINALEAMGDKRGTLTITAGETEDHKPFYSVSDTGEGMSETFIAQRLFHPFATTKRKGVGLGLYTCREVVTANGGRIDVESRQGSGTTFRVVLPSAQSKRGE